MIDFVLPSLGADMDEAKLVRWLVGPGDAVHKGQIIAEVETDKAVLEVECWSEGLIEDLIVQPGPERLVVGTVLARIRSSEEAVPIPPALKVEKVIVAPPLVAAAEVPPPIRHLAHELGVDLTGLVGTGTGGTLTRDDIRRAAGLLGGPEAAPPGGPEAAPPGGPEEGRIKASPQARRMAADVGIDLAAVTPTGPGGLVTAADVVAAADRISRPGPPAETPEIPAEPEGESRIGAMRRAIARSMSHSNRDIPHYYLATRIDLTRAMLWLEDFNTRQPLAGRVLPAALMLKATALALRENPELNGYWIDDRFQSSDAVHLGVAISLREGGLVAPAIHDADKLDLGQLMAGLRDLVNRARSWRLKASEMSDPTATVTNLGDRGVEMAFPIIIPPQVAMVGFGKVMDEPVARGGMVGVAPMVHATLSGDHRASDGHRGGLLLMSLDRLLQEPERL
jgi:pyruvate dehydrogenase E2 component (dihydrolipoamide acetyltransferase)